MPRSFSVVLRLGVFAILLEGAPAFAQSPNGSPTTTQTRQEKANDFGAVPIVDAEPPTEPAKRPVPDYDGRGEKPKTTADALLWIPRILVSPIYLATEYLIRRPIGALVIAAERDKLVQRILYVLRVGGKSNVGFTPTFQWDYQMRPSVGLYAWWDDFVGARNQLRVYAADWGVDVVNAAVADRYAVGSRSNVSIEASYLLRDDYVFYGIGPDSKQRNESRFEQRTFEAGPGAELEIVPGVELKTKAGVRDVLYDDTSCCTEPQLFDAVRAGRFAPPPRFLDGGYTTLFDAATVAVDSRRDRHDSGARLALTGAPSFDVSQRPGPSWLRYEAHASAFWDVTHTQRIVTLSASALFVDPLQGGGAGIPFTEQISLGGSRLMRGFLPGRLVDRSAAVATLAYEWPIWAFLDGELEAALGNVFGAGLRGFDVDRLRFSGVVGVRSNTSRDHQFELLTGFGTEPFDQGAAVRSFRLAIGATRGF